VLVCVILLEEVRHSFNEVSNIGQDFFEE